MRRSLAAVCLGATVSLLAVACSDDDSASLPTHPAAADADEGELTHGYVRDPAPTVGDLSLPDLTAGGENFAFQAPEGGMLLVFFGFTNCPDICPGTMMNLGRVSDELAQRGSDEGYAAEDISVAMVTVDPDRDLDSLADYVTSFTPDGHALGTEDDEELRRVATVFGASYEVADGADGPDVGHTDVLYGVDDTGTVVMNWPFGVTVDEIIEDLDQLAQPHA